ncbi:hypothetical protein HY988_05990 [Candidatus Micrarchaeota archaeon]|nr:hypothetical protein [Candidatus Micrarchaeota archaeon]
MASTYQTVKKLVAAAGVIYIGWSSVGKQFDPDRVYDRLGAPIESATHVRNAKHEKLYHVQLAEYKVLEAQRKAMPAKRAASLPSLQAPPRLVKETPDAALAQLNDRIERLGDKSPQALCKFERTERTNMGIPNKRYRTEDEACDASNRLVRSLTGFVTTDSSPNTSFYSDLIFWKGIIFGALYVLAGVIEAWWTGRKKPGNPGGSGDGQISGRRTGQAEALVERLRRANEGDPSGPNAQGPIPITRGQRAETAEAREARILQELSDQHGTTVQAVTDIFNLARAGISVHEIADRFRANSFDIVRILDAMVAEGILRESQIVGRPPPSPRAS